MTNLALEKPVEEDMRNAVAATDGDTSHYDGYNGFADFQWPGTLTVDLQRKEIITCIRVLLWDGLGQPGAIRRDGRTYRYRLLCSTDHLEWRVLFDTFHEGTLGWQVFNMPAGFEVRYVRVYGTWNSANRNFQVVQLEAYDRDPPTLAADVFTNREIVPTALPTEKDEEGFVSARVNEIIADVERLVDSSHVLNPVPFKELMTELRRYTSDIHAIERSANSIRREIISPVKTQLEIASKLGRYSVWGFWVGIAGGVLAIVSLIQNVFFR